MKLKPSIAISRYPARVVTAGFALCNMVGTLMLWMPFSAAPGRDPITFMQALFTSTSALCVTGLSLRSTGDDFSIIGQSIILVLIQIGGVGIMTLTTLVAWMFGAASDLRHQELVQQTLGVGDRGRVRMLLQRVIATAFVLELIGAVLLTVRFRCDMPLGEAIWFGTFHSISAFCNAGFSLWNDSLTRYATDWYVNGVVCGLIVLGGLGFPVLLDFIRCIRNRRRQHTRLTLHSKLTLWASGLLILGGACALWMLERNDLYAGKPLGDTVLMSLFQSVSARTAGFNTVDMTHLSHAAVVVTMILMFIGAGSCSTAGGVKVSTVGVLALSAFRAIQGHEETSIFRRTIPHTIINQAMTVLVVFASIECIALIAVLAWQPNETKVFHDLDVIAFEVVSALGTVGLSTGATAKFGTAGHLILTLLMFLGRVGPLSVFFALSRLTKRSPLQFAPEKPIIG